MLKKILLLWICLWMTALNSHAEDDYIKITAETTPKTISRGQEATLKLKITPRNDVRLSFEGFKIKLDENTNLSFPKDFFTASELDLETKQDGEAVYLALNREIPIPFKANENAKIGKQEINGEVIFTAVFEDNWSVKTYQRFNAGCYTTQERLKRKK